MWHHLWCNIAAHKGQTRLFKPALQQMSMLCLCRLNEVCTRQVTDMRGALIGGEGRGVAGLQLGSLHAGEDKATIQDSRRGVLRSVAAAPLNLVHGLVRTSSAVSGTDQVRI